MINITIIDIGKKANIQDLKNVCWPPFGVCSITALVSIHGDGACVKTFCFGKSNKILGIDPGSSEKWMEMLPETAFPLLAALSLVRPRSRLQ